MLTAHLNKRMHGRPYRGKPLTCIGVVPESVNVARTAEWSYVARDSSIRRLHKQRTNRLL